MMSSALKNSEDSLYKASIKVADGRTVNAYLLRYDGEHTILDLALVGPGGPGSYFTECEKRCVLMRRHDTGTSQHEIIRDAIKEIDRFASDPHGFDAPKSFRLDRAEDILNNKKLVSELLKVYSTADAVAKTLVGESKDPGIIELALKIQDATSIVFYTLSEMARATYEDDDE